MKARAPLTRSRNVALSIDGSSLLCRRTVQPILFLDTDTGRRREIFPAGALILGFNLHERFNPERR